MAVRVSKNASALKFFGGVRKRAVDLGGMKTKRAGVRAILTQVGQSADRSSLFHWMVEHHNELLANAKGRKMNWVELCVSFGTLGLTNQQGEIATERTARETWYRARKEVARLRAYAARHAATDFSDRSLMPSAAPAARRPTPLPQSTIPLSSAAKPQPNAPGPVGDTMRGVEGPVSKEVAKARLAELRRTLEERSGR